MYRIHRLAPFAIFALLALLVIVFALGSASQATAESEEAATTSGASSVTPAASTDPNVVRELVEKRTENSRTFLLKDGRLKSEVFEGPINFQDATGAWREINTDLVATGNEGEYVSAATPVKVGLSLSADAAPVLSLEYQGGAIEFTMKDQVFASPKVDGSTASYAALEPGQASTTTDTTSGAVEASTTTDTASVPAEASTATDVPSTPGEIEATTDTATLGPVESSTTTDTIPVPVETSTTTDVNSAPVEASPTTDTAMDPGVTLSYQVLDTGVKETISLANATSANTFTFTVSHPGLTMWQDTTGQWGLYEMIEYPPVLVMGGLTVFDSSLNEIGDPAFCADATMEVTPGTDQSTVTITVPQKWLADSTRTFPVMIDPSFTFNSSSADTYVATNPAGTSYGSLNFMSVGYSQSVRYRSFVKFDLASLSDFAGSDVDLVQLFLHQNWQSTQSPKMMHVAQMTKEWSESSTCNSLGAYDLPHPMEQMVGTGAQGVTFQSDAPGFAGLEEVAQYWADGGPNDGFCIYTDYIQQDHVRKFDTRECGTSAYRPHLTIYYFPPVDVTSYGADGTDT